MPEMRFAYTAFEATGKRAKGSLMAASLDEAFEQLKARKLAPIKVRPARGGERRSGIALTDREVSAFAADLGALLRAGADMRAALSILAPKSARPQMRELARAISTDIAGGVAVDRAVLAALPKRHSFIAALITAGAASGDIGSGLERAAEILDSRLAAKDQLVSALAYPVFVLISAIVALAVILLAVIPSLAPMAEAPGSEPGQAMLILLALSRFLSENLDVLGIAALVLFALGVAGGVLRLWGPAIDFLLMRGPFHRLSASFVYGAFSVSLGGMLAAGAPMAEALRLAIGTTRSRIGRNALDPVLREVRQGERLSSALERVKGFPASITRLAVVGERSAALGPMLIRAGRFEEKSALRRIEVAGRIIGPVLIVALGGLIGLMMTGLLTAVSGLGSAGLE